MIKLKQKEESRILERIWDLHYQADMARQSSLEQYRASMRLYMDQVTTERELRLIHERGQSDVSVNFLRFFLRKLQAYMTSNQPQWIAFATGKHKLRKSVLANAILGHIWRNSDGYLWIVDIIKNMTVGGNGLFSGYIDYRSRQGLGDILMRSLPYQYFYPDWRSKHPLNKDASFQQVAYTITLNTALSFLPKELHEKAKKLSTEPYNYDTLFQEDTLTYGEFPDPQQLTRLRYVTHYQIEERNIWELKDLISGEIFRYNDDVDVPLPYAVEKRKLGVPTLVKYDCLYGMGEDDGIVFDKTYFPFDNFLITPCYDEWTGNPYGIGEAYFIEKLQKYIDKSLRVALQHEQWRSNPGVFLPRNSVDDIRETEKRLLIPGFVEEINMEDGSPVFKQTGGGQSGFFNIMDMLINAMNQSMGNMFTPDMSKGNAKEAQFLKQTGQEQGDMIFRNFQASFERHGNVMLQLAKYFYKEPMLLQFIDNRKRPSSIPVNQTFVNEDGDLEQYYLDDIDFEIALSTKSMTPTNNQALVDRVIAASQFAPEAVRDTLFVEISRLLELDPDMIDEMEAKLQILPQIMSQLQQLEQSLNEIESENKKLQGQVFTADRKAVRAGYEAELEKQINDFKLTLRNISELYDKSIKMQEQVHRANLKAQNNKPKQNNKKE